MANTNLPQSCQLPIHPEKPILGTARGSIKMQPGWDEPMTPEEVDEVFGY
jgi:hypothetical protein